MSRLKPNVDYIYETVNGIIYSREFGSLDKFEIGRTHERTTQDLLDLELWKEIFYAARENPALQQELDRVKMFYLLMKQQESTSTPHHPV